MVHRQQPSPESTDSDLLSGTLHREARFERALQAGFADPLWLLGRQWQSGELCGRDCGSPALATIAARCTLFDGYRHDAGVSLKPLPAAPLEVIMQRQRPDFDLTTRAAAGRHLLSCICRQGEAYNHNAADHPFDQAWYRDLLRTTFAFDPPPVINDQDDDAGSIRKAQVLSRPSLHAMHSVLAGRGIDGVAAFDALRDEPARQKLLNRIPRSHRGWFRRAVDEFDQWFSQLYSLPANVQDNGWNDSRMEYGIELGSCIVPQASPCLHTRGRHGQELAWYDFDLLPPGSGGDTTGIDRSLLCTALPVPVEYPGMAPLRLWEIEEHQVNVADFSANPADITRIVVSDYMVNYDNDWFIVPLRLPVGSLTAIDGVVVTDVFGVPTFIPADGAGNGCATAFMPMSVHDPHNPARSGEDSRLFLAPVLAHCQRDAGVEQVSFRRDRLSGMVWAVEERISDGVCGSMCAHEAARSLQAVLADHGRQAKPAPVHRGWPDGSAVLRYQPGASVADTWIPFVPVSAGTGWQQATGDSVTSRSGTPVQPGTALLRNQQTLDGDGIDACGTHLAAGFNRARWIDGTVFTWYGFRRTPGRHPGPLAVRFDRLE